MIKPTVNRHVYFFPATPDNAEPGTYNQSPHAAIIAHVFTDRLVNLACFNSSGALYSQTSVPLLQDDDLAPAGGYYATWMDYQKGQAAKTEELEQRLGITDPASPAEVPAMEQAG